MNKKTLIMVAAGVLILVVGIAYAAQWYFSSEKTTTVISYQVTLASIPLEAPQYQNLTLTGQVLLGGLPVETAEVYLYKNEVDIDDTLTNSTGHYAFEYNVTDTVGSTLVFKTGILA